MNIINLTIEEVEITVGWLWVDRYGQDSEDGYIVDIGDPACIDIVDVEPVGHEVPENVIKDAIIETIKLERESNDG